jgi:hypothetical protein
MSIFVRLWESLDVAFHGIYTILQQDRGRNGVITYDEVC